MYNLKTSDGTIIQLDFDAMTNEVLNDLESSIFVYKMARKERDIQKSVNTIINCIEAEMKKCPDLKDRTAIITDESEYLDWFDVLRMMKDTE